MGTFTPARRIGVEERTSLISHDSRYGVEGMHLYARDARHVRLGIGVRLDPVGVCM
jgi:hypothetical protein